MISFIPWLKLIIGLTKSTYAAFIHIQVFHTNQSHFQTGSFIQSEYNEFWILIRVRKKNEWERWVSLIHKVWMKFLPCLEKFKLFTSSNTHRQDGIGACSISKVCNN